jgi:hypothetical protein
MYVYIYIKKFQFFKERNNAIAISALPIISLCNVISYVLYLDS